MGDLKALFITGIIISALVIGISSFYSDIAVNYGVSSTNVAFLNKTKDFQGRIEAIQNKTTAPASEAEAAGFILFAPFEAAKLTSESAGILSGLAEGVSDPQQIGVNYPLIPPWVSLLLTTLLLGIIIFALISAWQKWSI